MQAVATIEIVSVACCCVTKCPPKSSGLKQQFILSPDPVGQLGILQQVPHAAAVSWQDGWGLSGPAEMAGPLSPNGLSFSTSSQYGGLRAVF